VTRGRNYTKGVDAVDVAGFKESIDKWAKDSIESLVAAENKRERDTWAADVRLSFSEVSLEHRVPISLARFPTSSLEFDASRLRTSAISYGRAGAESELIRLAFSLFLSWQMGEVLAGTARKGVLAAMQLASEEQDGPPVQPVIKEVMHMYFPETEGCTLRLYTNDVKDGFEYACDNSGGRCYSGRQTDVAAFEGDEWMVSMFILMEGIYRTLQKVPT